MTYQKLMQAKIKGLDIGVKVWGCTVLKKKEKADFERTFWL